MPFEDQELARILRLRRLLWLWPLTFIPVLFVAVRLFPHPAAVIVGLAAVWAVGLAISATQAAAVLCPRCGKRFNGRRMLPNAHACASCGLPLKPRHVVYPTLE